jgi:hypothetical protein
MRFQTLAYLTFWLIVLCLILPMGFSVGQGVDVRSTPYATVTDERLQHPEAGDWLMYRRTYDGSGYSP